MIQSETRTKKHFEILDGLRGIAAITVVAFHLLEIFSGGNHARQIINHGYLAVDFFFVLSGFVIGYAYDERQNLSVKEFAKRRLIRLHPMIFAGMLIGAAIFYLQVSPELFPNIAQTPAWKLFLLLIIGCTLLPLGKGLDIRGWDEMYPLNGPAWSLFYEYLANIAYILILRKLPTKILTILVAAAAAFTLQFVLNSKNGDMIGGWSLAPEQMRIGFTRLIFPFLAGLLLSRIARPKKIENAFLFCTIILVSVLAVPRIGGETAWLNGLYEALAIIFIFPFLVWLGSCGSPECPFSIKISRFLGEISYPLYITHYPFIYLFSAWVVNNKKTMAEALPTAIFIWFITIFLAFALFKFYDEPVRKLLASKFFSRGK